MRGRGPENPYSLPLNPPHEQVGRFRNQQPYPWFASTETQVCEDIIPGSPYAIDVLNLIITSSKVFIREVATRMNSCHGIETSSFFF